VKVVAKRVTVVPSAGRRLEVLTSERAAGDRVPLVVHLGTPTGLVALPAALTPADGTRTVLYARPGYSRSTPQPGRSVADAAHDTTSILDALDIESFVTVGWSGGGPHALACAALLPERCLATAVIAGIAPYPAPVRDWTAGKAGLVLSGVDDALEAACEADRAASSMLTGDDMAEMFPAEPDREALTGAYADWLASCMRSAFLTSSAGLRDDWKAFMSDWGFDLGDARRVVLWHGDQDEIVTPAHTHWLAEHLPDANLHLLPGEAHLSIGLRLPEIVDDLTERARPTR
jgi:pimeloyl-ACP methyl ester carboxylesterase